MARAKAHTRLNRLEQRVVKTTGDNGEEARRALTLRLDRQCVDEQERGALDAALAGDVRATLNGWLTTNDYPDLAGKRSA